MQNRYLGMSTITAKFIHAVLLTGGPLGVCGLDISGSLNNRYKTVSLMGTHTIVRRRIMFKSKLQLSFARQRFEVWHKKYTGGRDGNSCQSLKPKLKSF